MNTQGEHLQASNLSSVVTLTPPEESVRWLYFQVLTQNARMTVSNTPPTSSKGFVITADSDPRYLEVQHGDQINFIEETSGATLEYQWLISR